MVYTNSTVDLAPVAVLAGPAEAVPVNAAIAAAVAAAAAPRVVYEPVADDKRPNHPRHVRFVECCPPFAIATVPAA